jgi:hypothetical protein
LQDQDLAREHAASALQANELAIKIQEDAEKLLQATNEVFVKAEASAIAADEQASGAESLVTISADSALDAEGTADDANARVNAAAASARQAADDANASMNSADDSNTRATELVNLIRTSVSEANDFAGQCEGYLQDALRDGVDLQSVKLAKIRCSVYKGNVVLAKDKASENLELLKDALSNMQKDASDAERFREEAARERASAEQALAEVNAAVEAVKKTKEDAVKAADDALLKAQSSAAKASDYAIRAHKYADEALASAAKAGEGSVRAAGLKDDASELVKPAALAYAPEILATSFLAREAVAANLKACEATANAILKAEVVPKSTYRADARAYSDECYLKETEATEASTDANARAEDAINARVNAIAAATSSDAVAASLRAVEAARLAGFQKDLAEEACTKCQPLANDAWLSDTYIVNANTATEQAIAEATAAIAAAAAALAAAETQTTALTLAGENLKKLSTRTMLRDVGLLEDGVGAWEVGYGRVRLAGVDGPSVAVPNGFVPPPFQKHETVQQLAKAAYDSFVSFSAQGLEALCMKSFDAANPPPIITSPLKAKMSDWDTRKLQEYQSARAVHLAEAKAYAAAAQKSIAASKRFFRAFQGRP